MTTIILSDSETPNRKKYLCPKKLFFMKNYFIFLRSELLVSIQTEGLIQVHYKSHYEFMITNVTYEIN